MSVRLRYELRGTGWSECELEIDEQRVVASASYLSDALDELCRAVVEILRGERSSRAAFDEEPGEYRWLFDRIGDERLRIRVLDFPELWGNRPDEEGELLFDAECRLRTFAGALLSELQRLLETYGESGYREKWAEHEFPMRRMHQLRDLLSASKPPHERADA